MKHSILQRQSISAVVGALPWQWSVLGRTAMVWLPHGYHALSWAPLSGGYARPRLILNHQVESNDLAATTAPERHLRAVAKAVLREQAFGRRIAADATVAMMTAADVSATAYAVLSAEDIVTAAWCTAGCSNALRVGDPATFETGPGTINMIVATSAPLSRGALVEAIEIATEARVVEVMNAGVSSRRSGKPATGTGTDCIVVTSPLRSTSHRYCGKHTLIGELIGRTALQACARALAAHKHRARRPVNLR